MAGPAPDCDDGISCTLDACNEVADACDNTADDSLCEDGDLCNGTETCDPDLGCAVGPALACDDGNPCTVDSCDALGGCSNLPIADGTVCEDGSVCTVADTCQASVCIGGTMSYGFHGIPIYPDGTQLNTQLGEFGSGGCVRQPDYRAAALYDWTPIGTTVHVLP